MQVGCQNEKKKKHGSNERTEQNSRKRTRQNGDKQSTRCRVQNTSYKVFNKLRGRADKLRQNIKNIKKSMR